MTFTEYATSKNLQLHRDDIKFIKAQVAGLNPAIRKQILTQYVDIWIEAMETEPIAHKRQNKGRRAANNYLRLSTHQKN